LRYLKVYKKFVRSGLISIIISFFVSPWALAQQDPQFSMNMFNQFAVNPGYTGSQNMINAYLIHRIQWMNVDGAPTSDVVGLHTPFKLFGLEHGVGILFKKDEYFTAKNIEFSLSYAYRFSVGKGKMGIGANIGYLNNDFAPNWKYPYDITGSSSSTDNVIPTSAEKINVIDAGAGIWYSTDEVYFGASFTHLNSPKLKYTGTNSSGTSETKLLPHAYLTAGYNYQLPSNPLITLSPSVFIMTYGQGTQLNFNTNITYNDKIWAGVSYRVNDAITGMVGFQLFNGMKIGVAYDANVLSPVGKFSDGSVEIMVSYAFGLKREKFPHRYKSIRFL
jgi:type IX secretion system PorP/SprF family membrane protein